MINDKSYTVEQVQKEAENYFSKRDKGRGSGYKQYKRWEYQALQLMDENGYLKKDDFYLQELKRHNNYSNKRNKSTNLNDYREEQGPKSWNNLTSWNPGVGRIISIAVDKSNKNHIIVGSNTSGVWKTTNEGANWTPLTDNHNNFEVY